MQFLEKASFSLFFEDDAAWDFDTYHIQKLHFSYT